MSSTRALTLKIAGDASGALKELDEVARKGDGLGGNLAKAGGLGRHGLDMLREGLEANGSPLGNLLGAVSTGIGTFQNFGEAVEHTGGKFEKLKSMIGPAMLGIGSAAMGLGAAMNAIGGPYEESMKRLESAVSVTGKSFEEFAKPIEETKKHMASFGFTGEDTAAALEKLTTKFNDPEMALHAMNATLDIAKSKHISLAEATLTVGKMYDGAAKPLKQYGISAEETGKQAAAAFSKAEKAATTADNNVIASKHNLEQAELHLKDAEIIASSHRKMTIGQQIQLTNLHNSVAQAEEKVKVSTEKATEAHKQQAEAQKKVAEATEGGMKNLDKLTAKLDGPTKAANETFDNKLKAIKASITNWAQETSAKWGPSLTMAGTGVTAVGAIIESKMIPSMIKGIGAAGTWAATHAASAASSSLAWAKSIGETLALHAMYAVETVATAWTAATGWIAANAAMLLASAGIILVLAAIAFGIYELVTHWKQCWTWIKEAAKAVWDWLKDVVGTTWNWIKDRFNDGMNAIQGVWDGIKKAASDVWKWFQDTIKSAIDFVVNLFLNFSGPGLLIKHWDDIKKAAAAAWDWVSGKIKGVIDGISGFFSGFGNTVSNIFSNLWHGIQNGWNTVTGFLGSLPGKILGAIGNLGNTLLNAGGDLLRGLWNGISGASGWLASKVMNWAGNLLPGWVKSALGIHSPSRVFAELGGHTAAGFGNGFTQGMSVQTGLMMDSLGKFVGKAKDTAAVDPTLIQNAIIGTGQTKNGIAANRIDQNMGLADAAAQKTHDEAVARLERTAQEQRNSADGGYNQTVANAKMVHAQQVQQHQRALHDALAKAHGKHAGAARAAAQASYNRWLASSQTSLNDTLLKAREAHDRTLASINQHLGDSLAQVNQTLADAKARAQQTDQIALQRLQPSGGSIGSVGGGGYGSSGVSGSGGGGGTVLNVDSGAVHVVVNVGGMDGVSTAKDIENAVQAAMKQALSEMLVLARGV